LDGYFARTPRELHSFRHVNPNQRKTTGCAMQKYLRSNRLLELAREANPLALR
jgi:hypothetical protein